MNGALASDVARQFLPVGTAFDIQAFGNGLINDTYLVSPNDLAQRFILQRLNASVFPDPTQILHNLAAIRRHLADKPDGAGDLQLPTLHPTRHGDAYFRDPHGAYWRALHYIAGESLHGGVANTTIARQIGWGLGRFHRMLSDLSPDALYDTLPGFHFAPGYLCQYRQALDNPQRPEACAAFDSCVAFIAEREDLAYVLEDAHDQGRLATRIIHGDPKLDNFLFDAERQHVLGLVDLDTVKPGLIHYDLGDCLRSCCREGEPAHFNLRICEAILHGYMQEAHSFLDSRETAYFNAAIQLLPFELGLRFFTDYLNGDRYFKTREPRHNLRRALDQFELLQSIEEQQAPIREMLAGLSAMAEPLQEH